MWSAGVILYILLSGVPPFWGDTEQEIFDSILSSGEPDFSTDPWPNISEDAKDCVRCMLERVLFHLSHRAIARTSQLSARGMHAKDKRSVQSIHKPGAKFAEPLLPSGHPCSYGCVTHSFCAHTSQADDVNTSQNRLIVIQNRQAMLRRIIKERLHNSKAS